MWFGFDIICINTNCKKQLLKDSSMYQNIWHGFRSGKRSVLCNLQKWTRNFQYLEFWLKPIHREYFPLNLINKWELHFVCPNTVWIGIIETHVTMHSESIKCQKRCRKTMHKCDLLHSKCAQNCIKLAKTHQHWVFALSRPNQHFKSKCN